MKNYYLMQAWLVLMLAMGFAAALAGVQVALRPRIDSNKIGETYKQIPSLVNIAQPDGLSVRQCDSAGEETAYKVYNAGEHAGWVIKAAGQGFADRIELLIGLSADASQILGMYVLDQKETPALGNKIVEPQWRGQFAGKDAAAAFVVEQDKPAGEDNSIQAVTGATVSSRSVCEIVNKASAAFRRRMGELKEKEVSD